MKERQRWQAPVGRGNAPNKSKVRFRRCHNDTIVLSGKVENRVLVLALILLLLFQCWRPPLCFVFSTAGRRRLRRSFHTIGKRKEINIGLQR